MARPPRALAAAFTAQLPKGLEPRLTFWELDCRNGCQQGKHKGEQVGCGQLRSLSLVMEMKGTVPSPSTWTCRFGCLASCPIMEVDKRALKDYHSLEKVLSQLLWLQGKNEHDKGKMLSIFPPSSITPPRGSSPKTGCKQVGMTTTRGSMGRPAILAASVCCKLLTGVYRAANPFGKKKPSAGRAANLPMMKVRRAQATRLRLLTRRCNSRMLSSWMCNPHTLQGSVFYLVAVTPLRSRFKESFFLPLLGSRL